MQCLCPFIASFSSSKRNLKMLLSDILVALLACNKTTFAARVSFHKWHSAYTTQQTAHLLKSIHELVCLFQHKTKDIKNTLAVLFYSRVLTDTHVFKSHRTQKPHLKRGTQECFPNTENLLALTTCQKMTWVHERPPLSLGMKPQLRTGAGQRGVLQSSCIL